MRYCSDDGEVVELKGDEAGKEWEVAPHDEEWQIDMLDLSEEEQDRWLYSCTIERIEKVNNKKKLEVWPDYVVRKINLKDLLATDSYSELQRVNSESNRHLSVFPGCGVYKSRIMFAGGRLCNRPTYTTGRKVYSFHTGADCPEDANSASSSDELYSGGAQVYSFDAHDDLPSELPSEPMDPSELPPGTSHIQCPLMVELDGKLYALSFYSRCLNEFEREEGGRIRRIIHGHNNFISLHVYEEGGWNPLNHLMQNLPIGESVLHDGFLYPVTCHAVVGTKLLLFTSFHFHDCRHPQTKVFSFDPESGPERQWRQLRAPRFGFSLPSSFQGKALVVNHSNINLLFFFDHVEKRIGVYTVSDLDDLTERQEFVKLVGYFKLPQIPTLPYIPYEGDFFHLGGTKVCFVSSSLLVHKYHPQYDQHLGKLHEGLRSWLVAMPFQFDIVVTPEKKHFTLNFMPPRISRYSTSNYVLRQTGCFLL